MPEWIIAMFLIGALLSAGDMAKIFLEARRSRREAAVYDNHPQKLQMEHYADSFRVLAESFYQMPSKSVMPETGRVDKILEKEQQEVCSRCATASWCCPTCPAALPSRLLWSASRHARSRKSKSSQAPTCP